MATVPKSCGLERCRLRRVVISNAAGSEAVSPPDGAAARDPSAVGSVWMKRWLSAAF
jgi:hypothetical protein